MIKVVIIDDKGTNIKTLKVLLQDYCPDVAVLASATSVAEGYSSILSHRPDVVFLDIELIHESGFDLVQKFGAPFFEIIFTTAYSQYALEAVKVQALDYLLKPIGIEELQAALQKAEQKIALKQARNQLHQLLHEKSKSAHEKIALPTLEGYKFVDQKDIVYCKASGSYTYFFLTNGKQELVCTGIGLCEQLLAPPAFFRVHHSFIVNIAHVDKYVKGRGGYLVLDEGRHVDESISRKDDFLKVIGHV